MLLKIIFVYIKKYFYYLQQQFITITLKHKNKIMQQIPILINRKGSNSQQQAFKIFPIEKSSKINHHRQKTYHSIEKQSYNERKHDTLDPNKLNQQYRYRRISSSGGGQSINNKFPKDFFINSDLPKTPIKIRFSKSKKDTIIQSSISPNILKFKKQQPHTVQYHKKKYTLQSPQRNCQLINNPQVQTPKFNHKNTFYQQSQSNINTQSIINSSSNKINNSSNKINYSQNKINYSQDKINYSQNKTNLLKTKNSLNTKNSQNRQNIKIQVNQQNSQQKQYDSDRKSKSKTTINKKIKLQDYLIHKKQNFPTFFKKSSQFQQDQLYSSQLNNINKNSNNLQNQNNQFISIQNNFNPIINTITNYRQKQKQNEQFILLDTLGKNNNLLKKISNETKTRKRIISQMEKENQQEVIPSHKKNQKSIKAFLSTKGFNWKVLQQINQMKPKYPEDSCAITFNIKEQKDPQTNKNCLSARTKKGLSQLVEQNQKNTFRIRKFQ